MGHTAFPGRVSGQVKHLVRLRRVHGIHGCMNFTVEPPNKGHFGANSFVPCREVVPISEGPLSEVPLYM